MENQSFDIFGSSAIDVNAQSTPERKESVIYAPKAKDVADGIYVSKIRFLYNPTDPVNGSILKKIVYYIKDASGQGNYFDSPQSIGDWNGCPIGQLWKQLSNSESALDQKNAKELNRREVYYSLVYIIDDKPNPSNNGKIKILKYGKKLKAKLDRYLDPKTGPKVDIFNFYTGFNFDLTITRQGNYNDYDQAGFEIQPSRIPIEGLTGGDGDREVLQKFMENAPNLEDYRYKAWDDAERAKLESILNQFRSHGSSRSNIVQEKGSTETPLIQSTPSVQAATAEPISHVAETTSSTTNKTEDGDLDSFLDDLGI
jgi:hypothetical protein